MLATKTQERRQPCRFRIFIINFTKIHHFFGVFIVNFEKISHFILVIPLLNLNK